jgi:hypothetical protein
MMRLVKYTLFALALAFITRAADADSIGLNFAADDPDTASSSVTEAAGLLGTANWNNLAGGTGSATDLINDSGAATAAAVDWSSNNTWRSGIGNRNNATGGDSQLMNGYLDYLDGAEPTDHVVPTITVNGLDAALGSDLYDVYVYIQGDSSQVRGGEWTVNGVTKSLVDDAPFDGTYVAGENYLKFSGISGDSIMVSSLAVSLGGGETLRAPINGIEIQGVPEPCSVLLLGLGAVGAAVRRRR